MEDITSSVYSFEMESHPWMTDTMLDDTIQAMERMEPNKFRRFFSIYRVDQLGKTIFKIGPKVELPYNSVYHVIDNLNYPEHDDMPRVVDDPFITQESNKKWIYHVSDFVSGPCTEYLHPKMIFRTSGLTSSKMKFKSTYRNKFYYVDRISDLPKKKDALIVVNHNPLFRAIVRGRLNYYRKIMLILSSVFNTTTLIDPSKNQFIHIPLTSSIFSKEMFIKTKNKGFDITSIKYPYSFHYIFMAHLLNWLDPNTSHSFLRQMEVKDVSKLNLILSVPHPDGILRAIIVNLGLLRSFNEKNRKYLKIVNHLNCLAASSHVDEKKLSLEYDVEIVEDEVEDKVDDVIDLPKKEETSTSTTIKDIDVNDVKDRSTELIHDVKKVSPVKEVRTKVASPVTNVITSVSDHFNKVLGDPPKDKKSIQAGIKSGDKVVNTEEVTRPTKLLDEKTSEWIDSYQEATPKEKLRMKILSEKYKKLTLDGVTLDKWIDGSLDKLNGYKVPKELDIPDPKMTESTIKNYNAEYVKTTAKRHLAQIVTGFQDQGLVLIDFKEKKVIDRLNHLTKYSVTYLDLETNTQSTSHFTLPVPDEEGKMKINGVDHYLKTQLVNKPIVKISDTVVSLMSGLNKTQVIRNTTTRSSFIHQFKKAVVLGESQNVVKAVPGSNEYNSENLPYEFTEIAKKYSAISLTKESSTYSLSFVLDGNKTTNHGIYLGTVEDKTIYMDPDNVLHYIDKDYKTVEGYPVSILGIFQSTLKDPSKLPIVNEWVDIKLLDKNFPLIFLLAYRFGLKNILDYLEVSYTLLDKKKNVVDDKGERILVTTKIPELERLDDLGLTQDQYVIVGSTAAVAYGMDKKVNDIDIIVPSEVAKSLHDSGKVIPHGDNGRYKTRDGLIDINTKALNSNREAYPGYQANSTEIDGYTFLTYDGLLQFYRILYKKNKEEKHLATLEWLKANRVERKTKHERSATDIYIPFNDCILVVDRYPLTHSFILAGLNQFSTSKYFFNEFDNKDVYYSLLIDKGYGTNYIKGIDVFFDLFLNDQMTVDALRNMGEPTNLKDLLIRATYMLTTTYHIPPSSMANYRIRGVEQLNTILHNELSRQFANYKNRKIKGSKFTINPEAVFQRILQTETLTAVDETNPIHAIKETLSVTYSGQGGRSSESFVIRDRKYPKDGIGILGDVTVDSSKVAINTYLTMNPSITDPSGTISPDLNKKDSKDSSDVLSVVSNLNPCILGDDSKRILFASVQYSHVIGTKSKDLCRVRTGMEQVIPYMTSKAFSGIAKDDGRITRVDENNKIVLIDYKDGTSEVFDFKDGYKTVAGSIVTQKMKLNVKEGDKVTKGDVICYNDNFFVKDKYSDTLSMSHGINATVAFMECEGTQEDSCRITTSLSDKLSITDTHVRTIKINSNHVIHDMVDINDYVKSIDTIMSFEESDALSSYDKVTDEETTHMLSKINRRIPKAKYTGTVVKIECFYSCDLSEMHPTVRKYVDKFTSRERALARVARGTLDEDRYPQVDKITPGTKYKGHYFGDDTVLFLIYITKQTPHATGDKCILGNQLKCTTMGTIDTPVVAASSGKPIDMFFSSAKAYGRVVLSAFLVGGVSRVLEECENQVIDEYFS